jgi:RimJ/RimL family protein N-acetyltransferase
MTIMYQIKSPAPTLETPRLILSAHRVEDFGDLAAMWSDPAVVRFIGGRPFSAEEVWTRLLRAVGHWPLMGFGYWVARERGSGRFVGEAGLADFRRDITPSFGGAPEAGWALAGWAHRRGLATEAMGAVLAWSDAELKPERTVCMISPGNAASIRVAEKCGYRELLRTAYRGEATVIFERRRSA